jgi:predicted nucleotide-binding protein (sugar kinase/HSP70/actin superfamily)
MAAFLQSQGYEAEVLPEIADPTLTLARQAVPRDLCLPAHVTLQHFLERVQKPGFEASKVAFVQAFSAGPCRLYGYPLEDEQVFARMGLQDAMVATLGLKGGFSLPAMLLGYDLFLAHDYLERMLLRVRPYETETKKGRVDQIFNYYVNALCHRLPDIMKVMQKGNAELAFPRHLAYLTDIVGAAASEFTSTSLIPSTRQRKPIVGVMGEFFVRLSEFSNQNLVRRLEELGLEVMLAPATEFLGHCVYTTGWLAWVRFLRGGHNWQDAKAAAALWLNSRLIRRSERAFAQATARVLGSDGQESPAEITRLGKDWVPSHLGGEAIISLGTAEHLRHHVDALISIGPFGCIVSTSVAMLAPEFQDRYGIPFVCYDFNGYPNPVNDVSLEALADSLKDRLYNK